MTLRKKENFLGIHKLVDWRPKQFDYIWEYQMLSVQWGLHFESQKELPHMISFENANFNINVMWTAFLSMYVALAAQRFTGYFVISH